MAGRFPNEGLKDNKKIKTWKSEILSIAEFQINLGDHVIAP